MIDVRNILSSEKHYVNLPMPLFRYLCSLDISRAQENVFLLHWGAGQIHGDWKSEIPIQTVATRLSLSESSVKRAYARLEELGLIHRYAQGRNPNNPMRAAITVTEVTIPDEAVEELLEAPSRAKAKKTTPVTPANQQEPSQGEEERNTKGSPSLSRNKQAGVLSYESLQVPGEGPESVFTSDLESATSRDADQHWENALEFDAYHYEAPGNTNPPEHELQLLPSDTLPTEPQPLKKTLDSGNSKKSPGRKVYAGYAFKLLKNLKKEVGDEKKAKRYWHQMLWSMEEGDYSQEPIPKAYNIMMWLLRRGVWGSPWGMPEGWEWSPQRESKQFTYEPFEGGIGEPV